MVCNGTKQYGEAVKPGIQKRPKEETWKRLKGYAGSFEFFMGLADTGVAR